MDNGVRLTSDDVKGRSVWLVWTGRRRPPLGSRDARQPGDFRVHGTQGLRVVDASVFPRIPGFFIVCAIYMVAEKAAAIILDAASARA